MACRGVSSGPFVFCRPRLPSSIRGLSGLADPQGDRMNSTMEVRTFFENGVRPGL